MSVKNPWAVPEPTHGAWQSIKVCGECLWSNGFHDPKCSNNHLPPSLRYAENQAPKEDRRKDTNPKDAIGVRKAGVSCIPANVMAELGVAMLEGASKYGRHNYRAAGVRASVYYDAAVGRHLMDWWEGDDIDKDSGLSHITKAIAALVVLRDSMMQDNWVDDRPPRSAPYRDEMNKRAGEVLDRHKDKAPKHYTEKDMIPNQTSGTSAPPNGLGITSWPPGFPKTTGVETPFPAIVPLDKFVPPPANTPWPFDSKDEKLAWLNEITEEDLRPHGVFFNQVPLGPVSIVHGTPGMVRQGSSMKPAQEQDEQADDRQFAFAFHAPPT